MASLATAHAESNNLDSFSVNVTSCTAPGYLDNAPTDVLISITPPSVGSRPPTDVCCVVDVSGSMAVECTNGDSESQGLSVMDIVKHACKTVLMCLTPEDRFSVVAYSTNASVRLGLTKVDASGKAAGLAAIEGLQTGGQTNLWDGLHQGLQVLHEGGQGQGQGRMKAVLLLTDGQPNVSPPRGHVPMLQQYKEETGMMCTISTFGFGYNLDSKLLKDLATEGQGMYAFIPDGSFVGTAFVNATSNVLSTCAREVTLKVSSLSSSGGVAASAGTAALLHPGALVLGHSGQSNSGQANGGGGGGVVQKASWGLQISLGSLQFGQTKNVVVCLPAGVTGSKGAFRADVEYLESGSSEAATTCGEGPSPPAADADPASQAASEAVIHGLRLRFVDALNQAVLTLGKDPTQAQLEACEAARLEFATTLAAVIASSSLSGPLSSSGELVNSGELGSGSKKAAARLADLLLDVEGQFKQAISRADWYKKWGRHYLPSLACAHLLQQCNNFKDPGVQHYGGSLFVFLRTAAEGIFVKLPPPEPSVVQAVVQATPMCRGSFSSMSAGGRAASASAVPVATRSRVDMSRYYDRGGGCFTGDALITLAVRGGAEEGGGEPATEDANPEASTKATKDTSVKRVKRVDQLRAGDQVKAFTRSSVDGKVTEGTGFVWFVAETLLSSPPLLVPVSSSSFSTTAGSSSSSSSSVVAVGGAHGRNPPKSPPPLRLTAWHPVLPNSPEPCASEPSSCASSCASEWAFPAELAAAAGVEAPLPTPLRDVPSVFNIALLPRLAAVDGNACATSSPSPSSLSPSSLWHGVELNGVRVITLNHGIANDRVASHSYFGSSAVTHDLALFAAEAALAASSSSSSPFSSSFSSFSFSSSPPPFSLIPGRVVLSQNDAAVALARHDKNKNAVHVPATATAVSTVLAKNTARPVGAKYSLVTC